MPRIVTRLRRPLALLLAVTLVVGIPLLPALAAPRGDEITEADINIEQFMAGLACVESGGRYGAENPYSGAYGKYQIMPANWPVWARRYLGHREAEPSPPHQEFVARARIQRLIEDRGSWRDVAYWWLTGRRERNEGRWTAKAHRYVDSVMAYAAMAAHPIRASRVPNRCFPQMFPGMELDALPRAWVEVKGGSVFVRREADPGTRVIDLVRRGDVLPVLDRERAAGGLQWLQVRLRDGRIGWIAGWYTRPAD